MKKSLLLVLFMVSQTSTMERTHNALLRRAKMSVHEIFVCYLDSSKHYLNSLNKAYDDMFVPSNNKKRAVLESMQQIQGYQKNTLHELQKMTVCLGSFQIILQEKTLDAFCAHVVLLLEFMEKMQELEKKSPHYKTYFALSSFYQSFEKEFQANKKIEKYPNKINDCIQFFENLAQQETKKPVIF